VVGVHMALPGQASAPSWNHHDLDHSTPFRTGSQALQGQGLGGKVFVTGVDAEPRAQELIKQGLMALSNFTAFDQMGVKAAQAALAVGNGKPIDANATVNNGARDLPWIKILNFNVTKDNLEQSAKDFPWWFQPKT